MSATVSLWRLFFGASSFVILGACFQYTLLSPCFTAERIEKPDGTLTLPDGFSLRDLRDVTNALIEKYRVVAPETVIVLSMEVVNERKLLVKVGLENALENGHSSWLFHKNPKKKIWEIESGEAVIE